MNRKKQLSFLVLPLSLVACENASVDPIVGGGGAPAPTQTGGAPAVAGASGAPQAVGGGQSSGGFVSASGAGNNAAGAAGAASGTGGSGGAPSVGGSGGVSSGGSTGTMTSAGSAGASQAGNAGQNTGGQGSGAGCSGQHVFCDDFEADALKAHWKEAHSGENSAELSSSFAHGGKRAYHFTMNAPANGGGFAHLTTQAPFATLGQHYFGRAYFFVDALPVGGVHVNYLTGRGPLASGETANYSYGLSDSNLMANYFVLSPWQDFWLNSSQKLPTGRWVCVEWEFNRAQNTMHQWLDGVAVTDQTIVGESSCCPGNPWNAPEHFAEQVLGWDYYQTSQTKHFNVWLDDVVLDSQRVGCGG